MRGEINLSPNHGWEILTQMRQIWDFLRSVSVMKFKLKSLRFVKFGAKMTHFVSIPDIPDSFDADIPLVAPSNEGTCSGLSDSAPIGPDCHQMGQMLDF